MMTEKKRFVQFEFPFDDFAVKDTVDNKELWNPEVVDRLNEYDSELQMCREKVVYWRNKANDVFGDMRTNVELEKRILELEKENKRLKLVVSEVIDAIIDDARVQLNEEFLEYADKFDSIDDLQNEVKKNLYDGDVE